MATTVTTVTVSSPTSLTTIPLPVVLTSHSTCLNANVQLAVLNTLIGTFHDTYT